MRTALVHDWLVTPGGAEKVLEEIWNLYPSPIFTLLDGQIMPGKEVFSSFLQKAPGAFRHYRYYLPFFPWAIEKFKLQDFDVLLSSSHAVAKGIRKRKDQLHICYCHTPMRYAWDLEEHYTETLDPIRRWGAKAILRYLRGWDLSATSRVDHFIANSNFVAQRIERIYQRKATVIYPPVATDKFYLSENKEDYYITVSRLVSYKRIDLMIEAFKTLPHRKLIVVGDGPEMDCLQKMAPSNVELKGRQSDAAVALLLSRARGFIFAAEEDFGIALVEAQASGTPVIAYGKGGALESVIEEKTGVFFPDPTACSLIESLMRFETLNFDSKQIKDHAQQFGVARFRKEFQAFVEEKWGEFCCEDLPLKSKEKR